MERQPRRSKYHVTVKTVMSPQSNGYLGSKGAGESQKTHTPKDSEGNIAVSAILIEDLQPTELEEDICLLF